MHWTYVVAFGVSSFGVGFVVGLIVGLPCGIKLAFKAMEESQ